MFGFVVSVKVWDLFCALCASCLPSAILPVAREVRFDEQALGYRVGLFPKRETNQFDCIRESGDCAYS